jgi:hypothetical protein
MHDNINNTIVSHLPLSRLIAGEEQPEDELVVAEEQRYGNLVDFDNEEY